MSTATDVMIDLYSEMMASYEGKINPLKGIHTMEQLACMRTDLSFKVYKALKPLPVGHQRYVLEILSKVRL